MDWKEEFLEFIRVEFHKGQPTGKIVLNFNTHFGTNITRNSVLSRLHSIGLRRLEHPTAVKSSKTRERKNGHARPQPPEGASQPLPPELEMPEQHCTLQELNRYRCHWPFGTESPYRFCGARTMKLRGEKRSAYCPFHHAVATTASFAKYN